jgi:hypothetical protein
MGPSETTASPPAWSPRILPRPPRPAAALDPAHPPLGHHRQPPGLDALHPSLRHRGQPAGPDALHPPSDTVASPPREIPKSSPEATTASPPRWIPRRASSPTTAATPRPIPWMLPAWGANPTAAPRIPPPTGARGFARQRVRFTPWTASRCRSDQLTRSPFTRGTWPIPTPVFPTMRRRAAPWDGPSSPWTASRSWAARGRGTQGAPEGPRTWVPSGRRDRRDEGGQGEEDPPGAEPLPRRPGDPARRPTG